MKFRKKFWSMGLVLVMVLSMMGCGSGDTASEETLQTEEGGSDDTTEENSSEVEESDGEIEIPTLDSIQVGEDYTDLTATIKVLTHRTDIVDTTFQDYIKQFNELYPNITIKYEAVTDYAESVTTRLTTDDWGDICMIVTTVDKDELPNLFLSFGDKDTLEESYIMLDNYAYEGEVYGIPSMGNAQGIVYNKRIFEEAGVTEIPKTPDEFLETLQKVKDNTEAIPLYTNFAAGWTLGGWDGYISGTATGDPDYTSEVLVHGDNPFSKQDDMTGPYAVYYTLYEAVARGLTEDDPTTTDWEGSKGMMNNGEIATMVLGSWAVAQMQEAGENVDDIGYMPFPITVDGKQYASAGPDYCYGINAKVSEENQLASMLYVKWLTEESNYAYDNGGVPIQVDSEYPEVLKSFDGVEFVIDNPAPEGEETLFDDINNDSELSLNSDNYHVANIVEAALAGSPTLDEIMEEWNEKWTAAQEENGAK